MLIAIIVFAVITFIGLAGLILTNILIGDKNPDHDLYPTFVLIFCIGSVITIILLAIYFCR